MDRFKIYLSGGMTGLTFEDQMQWRNQIRDMIIFSRYDHTYQPYFFNPPRYYNFENKRHKSEREVMEFDLNALRKSDLVIVNFNNPQSLGTAMELMVAYERKIPVVGICSDTSLLHPWLIECTNRMCSSIDEAAKYVVEFYVNDLNYYDLVKSFGR